MGSFDYTFACEALPGGANPWSTLRVVRFHGKEAISSPFTHDIVLLDISGSIAVAELIGKRATLRIATLSVPVFKTVHGIISEAEELHLAPEGRILRVTLVPPWARAKHRQNCRIFLEKPLRQIIETVLQFDKLVAKDSGQESAPDLGGFDYRPAAESFAWRIVDASRLDDARVHPYVVQYNESDFDFVSRLLEAEGISYHFEHNADSILLVLTDSDSGRPRLEPSAIGSGIDGREIRTFITGARLRPTAVSLSDYNWKQPDVDMSTRAGEANADLFEHVFPGLYPDQAAQGSPLAKIRLGRHQTEARFARGAGWIRVLGAGTIFELEHKTARFEGEYLVTSLDIRGEQAGVLQSNSGGAMEPFVAQFECARRGTGKTIQASDFRPACKTQRPRIIGSQTAIVTAEPSTPSAEINVGGPTGTDIGCVRLKFHWDTDDKRHGKESTSCWVRVNEPFAGSGSGGVWHPRVGTEVIVEFEEGNPDRPVIVGRVYNGVNRPYHGGSPVMSTFKSNSSPGGAVHNEITFDDSAGAELLYTNAGKDMETDVGNNRLETVAVNASMTVGANDHETIGANCRVGVGVNDQLTVGINDLSIIAGDASTDIGSNSITGIGANELHVVGANQTITIGATHTEIVGGTLTEAVTGTLSTSVTAAETQFIGGNRTTTVAGANTQQFGAAHIKLVASDRELTTTGNQSTTVGAASMRLVAGSITTNVTGLQTVNAGAGIIFIGPTYSAQDKTGESIDDTRINLTGISESQGSLSATVTDVSLSMAGLDISTGITNITLTTISRSLAGFKTGVQAADVETNGAKMYVGLKIYL
jgi:type VI secretion system secreted protein VgrG